MKGKIILAAGIVTISLLLLYIYLQNEKVVNTQSSHKQADEKLVEQQALSKNTKDIPKEIKVKGNDKKEIKDEKESKEPNKKVKDHGNKTPKDKTINKNPPIILLPEVDDEEIVGEPQVNNRKEAQEVLNKKKEQLDLGEGSDLEIDSETADEYGNMYYHLQQKYKGIPVYGTSSNLEIEMGKATVLSGTWIKNINIDIKPKYTAVEALTKVFSNLGVPSTRVVKEYGESSLIIIATMNKIRLCWKITAHLTNPDAQIERFVVDAHNPEIVLRNPLVNK